MVVFSYVLMKNVIHVQVCDCAAYNVLFRKHYFNHCEGCLLMAPMECQNMREEVLCIGYVYIAVHVRLVLYVCNSNSSNAFVFVDSNCSILVGI